MSLRIIVILTLAVTATAIRVPIDNEEENDSHQPVVVEDTTEHKPVYYIPEEPTLDSYLIPPDPHKQQYADNDSQTPATYLLPPLLDSQSYYYHPNPTEPGEQTDWQPVTQKSKINSLPKSNQSTQKIVEYIPEQEKGERLVLPIPSEQLEPPAISAPDDYIAPPADTLNLKLPYEDNLKVINLPPSRPNPVYQPTKVLLKPVDPTLALHLLPPKYQKVPTKFYPKKYNGAFRPIPIPIGQFIEKPFDGVPKAKPLKPFKPFLNPNNEHLPEPDEKKIYLYEQAKQKRKLKGDSLQQSQPISVEDPNTSVEGAAVEQEASETNFRHPGRNIYPAPLKQAPPTPQSSPSVAAAAPAPSERTEFRMHGMKGPHSYQFGYDTGKGKNRQFRYEERDNDGHVKGHYGYMDKHGKLRVVNYDAHPELGFRADAPKEEEP